MYLHIRRTPFRDRALRYVLDVLDYPLEIVGLHQIISPTRGMAAK